MDPQHTTMLGGYNHIKGPVYNRTPYLEKTWTHNIPPCWAAIFTSGGQSTTERPTWRRRGPTTYHHVGRLYPHQGASLQQNAVRGEDLDPQHTTMLGGYIQSGWHSSLKSDFQDGQADCRAQHLATLVREPCSMCTVQSIADR